MHSEHNRVILLHFEKQVNQLTITMEPSQVFVHTLAELVLRKFPAAFTKHSDFLILQEIGVDICPIKTDEHVFKMLSEGSPEIPLRMVIKRVKSPWNGIEGGICNPAELKMNSSMDIEREQIIEPILHFWELDGAESIPFDFIYKVISTFSTVGDPLMRHCERFSRMPRAVHGLTPIDLRDLLVEWTKCLDLTALQSFAEDMIETLHFGYNLSARSRLGKAIWEVFLFLDVDHTHTVNKQQIVSFLAQVPEIGEGKAMASFGEVGDTTEHGVLLGFRAYRQGVERAFMGLEEYRIYEVLHSLTSTPSKTHPSLTKQQQQIQRRLDTNRVKQLQSDIRHAFDAVSTQQLEAFTQQYAVPLLCPVKVAMERLILGIIPSEGNALMQTMAEDPEGLLESVRHYETTGRVAALSIDLVRDVAESLLLYDFQPEAMMKYGHCVSAMALWCRAVCELACVTHGWPWPVINGCHRASPEKPNSLQPRRESEADLRAAVARKKEDEELAAVATLVINAALRGL